MDVYRAFQHLDGEIGESPIASEQRFRVIGPSNEEEFRAQALLLVRRFSRNGFMVPPDRAFLYRINTD